MMVLALFVPMIDSYWIMGTNKTTSTRVGRIRRWVRYSFRSRRRVRYRVTSRVR